MHPPNSWPHDTLFWAVKLTEETDAAMFKAIGEPALGPIVRILSAPVVV